MLGLETKTSHNPPAPIRGLFYEKLLNIPHIVVWCAIVLSSKGTSLLPPLLLLIMTTDNTNLFSTNQELLFDVSSFTRGINAQMISIYSKFSSFSSEIEMMLEDDMAYRAYDCWLVLLSSAQPPQGAFLLSSYKLMPTHTPIVCYATGKRDNTSLPARFF